MKTYLSKSRFLKGLQCHKLLWLYKHKPELRTLHDESQQAIFDAGTEVGILAQNLFPDGKEIVFEAGYFNMILRSHAEHGNELRFNQFAYFIRIDKFRGYYLYGQGINLPFQLDCLPFNRYSD